MPTIMPDDLENIARVLLVGSGASEQEAEIVARHSIKSNLAGHDSHGIIQIPTYIDRVKRGHIVPGAEYDVVKDTPTTTVVDGHWGFGYVVTERTMKTTIEKAKSSNVAAATVYRQSHIGRLGAYSTMAANEDCLLYTSPSPRDPKTSRMPSSA